MSTYKLIVRRMQARDSGYYRCSVQSLSDTFDDFKDGQIVVLGNVVYLYIAIHNVLVKYSTNAMKVFLALQSRLQSHL